MVSTSGTVEKVEGHEKLVQDQKNKKAKTTHREDAVETEIEVHDEHELVESDSIVVEPYNRSRDSGV